MRARRGKYTTAVEPGANITPFLPLPLLLLLVLPLVLLLVVLLPLLPSRNLPQEPEFKEEYEKVPGHPT